MSTATKLDAITLRRLAVAGDGVHETTIKSYLAGKPVRAASRVRIERALRTLNLAHLIRVDAQPLTGVVAGMAAIASVRGPRA